MDSTAFTAQLAQFSSLEQLTNVNTNLTSLITSQNTLLHGMSVNLIGKTVTTNDGTSGTVTGISFDGDTTSVVLDSNQTVSLTNITKISS
jgi:Flagellar hook capping protein.